MDQQAAKEFSEAFGMIGAGWWRQIAWAQRQGIPAALDMTTREWVQAYVGGWAQLAVDERQQAVRELTDEGMKQREIADVLGIGVGTVSDDLNDPDRARRRAKEAADQAPQEDPDARGRALEDYASPRALRDAAVLRFASALMGAAEALERIDPPMDADEAQEFTVTASAIVRRLNRGQKLEAIK